MNKQMNDQDTLFCCVCQTCGTAVMSLTTENPPYCPSCEPEVCDEHEAQTCLAPERALCAMRTHAADAPARTHEVEPIALCPPGLKCDE
jgi:hypothetical protein